MNVVMKLTGDMVDLGEAAVEFITKGMLFPMDALGENLETRMKAICPVGKTGNLRDSISHRVVIYQNTNRILSLTGPARRKRGKPTRYAHLVEFGHRAGGWHKEAGGEHVPAHPFVRPTAELARATAVQVIGPGAAAGLIVAVNRAKGRKKIRLIKTFVK